MDKDLPPPDFSTSSTSSLVSVKALISSSWEKDLALPLKLESDFIFCNSLLIARARGVSVVVGESSDISGVIVVSVDVLDGNIVGMVVVSVKAVVADTVEITGVVVLVILGVLAVVVVVVKVVDVVVVGVVVVVVVEAVVVDVVVVVVVVTVTIVLVVVVVDETAFSLLPFLETLFGFLFFFFFSPLNLPL